MNISVFQITVHVLASPCSEALQAIGIAIICICNCQQEIKRGIKWKKKAKMLQLRFQNRNLDFTIILITCTNKPGEGMSASKGREPQVQSQFNWMLKDLSASMSSLQNICPTLMRKKFKCCPQIFRFTKKLVNKTPPSCLWKLNKGGCKRIVWNLGD